MISLVKKGVSLHSEARRKSLCIEVSINVGIVIEINENVESLAAFVARVISFAPCGHASYAAERKIQVPGSSFQLLLREKALFPATFVKFAQTRLFLFSKAKAQVFPVIAAAKIVVKIYLFGDQAVDVGEVLLAYFAETVREGLEVANFRSDQPERVYEGKTD